MSIAMKLRTAFIAAAALALSGCGINSVPTAEEEVNARWGDVQSAYQRRADLVPNLNAATQSMLDKAGLAAAENFIFNDGYVERLRFEVDPSWQGDIPRTMLVTRDGAISTIEGSAEISDLDKWSSEQGRPQ